MLMKQQVVLRSPHQVSTPQILRYLRRDSGILFTKLSPLTVLLEKADVLIDGLVQLALEQRQVSCRHTDAALDDLGIMLM